MDYRQYHALYCTPKRTEANPHNEPLPSGDVGVEVEEIAQSDADAQHPRVRGSGTDWMKSAKTKCERFPPVVAQRV